MPSHESPRTTGFSLVELSIVLVIVGLLTGGVLGGKSLIHASELRSVSTDMAKYQSAMVAFREKYNGLPGDLNNASSYWPSQCVDDTDNLCNGNNDGKIATNSNDPEPAWSMEELRMWQELSLAGLIEGNYTGLAPMQAKVSIPSARFGQGTYYVSYTDLSDRQGNAILFSSGLSSDAALNASGGAVSMGGGGYGLCYYSEGHTTCSGGGGGGGGGGGNSAMVGGATLPPEDMLNLDSKMDDGLPYSGGVRADNGFDSDGNVTSDCITTSGANTTYNMSANTTQCTMTMFVGS